MARTQRYEERVVTVVRDIATETVTCDKCSREIDPDGMDDDFANVLEIYLNVEQCVNDRVRMDLCTTCLLPIWQKICEAIGANPEGELRIGQDD